MPTVPDPAAEPVIIVQSESSVLNHLRGKEPGRTSTSGRKTGAEPTKQYPAPREQQKAMFIETKRHSPSDTKPVLASTAVDADPIVLPIAVA